MNAIGGYFQLDGIRNSFKMSENAVALNSGRNALRYILRLYRINSIYAPFFTCPAVLDAIHAENCHISFYNINEQWMPEQKFPANSYVLYNNYFGVCGANVIALFDQYPNLIVDNAHSFYSPHQGLAGFTSPRKFFGLPDGGYAFVKDKLDETLETDISYDRCLHLLRRVDEGATPGYSDFHTTEESLKDLPIRAMSVLTQRLINMQDIESARKKRLDNYQILANKLDPINKCKSVLDSTDVPLVYPFLAKCGRLREYLISQNIYVATYWPGIEQHCLDNSFELQLKNNLLALPIDQRYGVSEMNRILEEVCKFC